MYTFPRFRKSANYNPVSKTLNTHTYNRYHGIAAQSQRLFRQDSGHSARLSIGQSGRSHDVGVSAGREPYLSGLPQRRLHVASVSPYT